jgi:hypothetical protein
MSIDSGGSAVSVPKKAVKAKLSRLRAKTKSLEKCIEGETKYGAAIILPG